MRSKLPVIGLGVYILASGWAHSANNDISLGQDANDPKIFSFDYGVPESPALELSGLSTDKIKPATSLKPFVLEIPEVLGESGSGSAALDLSMGWLTEIDGRRSNYYTDYWKRFFTRARLGAVLYRGDDGGGDPAKAKPSKLAIGLSFSLLDASDPLTAGPDTEFMYNGGETEWDRCVNDPDNSKVIAPEEFDDVAKAIQNDLYTLGRPDVTPDQVQKAEQDHYVRIGSSQHPAPVTAGNLRERVIAVQGLLQNEEQTRKHVIDTSQARQKALTDCHKKASAMAEHGTDLQIGAGVVWSGTPGKLSGFDKASAAVWLSGRHRLGPPVTENSCGSDDWNLGSCWMVGASGRYSSGEMVATGDKLAPEFQANVTEGWIGLERVNGMSEFGGYVGYINQQASDSSDARFSGSGTRWLITADVSLDKWLNDAGVWLEGSYGNANGSVTRLDDKIAMLTLKFGPAQFSPTLK